MNNKKSSFKTKSNNYTILKIIIIVIAILLILFLVASTLGIIPKKDKVNLSPKSDSNIDNCPTSKDPFTDPWDGISYKYECVIPVLTDGTSGCHSPNFPTDQYCSDLSKSQCCRKVISNIQCEGAPGKAKPERSEKNDFSFDIFCTTNQGACTSPISPYTRGIVVLGSGTCNNINNQKAYCCVQSYKK